MFRVYLKWVLRVLRLRRRFCMIRSLCSFWRSIVRCWFVLLIMLVLSSCRVFVRVWGLILWCLWGRILWWSVLFVFMLRILEIRIMRIFFLFLWYVLFRFYFGWFFLEIVRFMWGLGDMLIFFIVGFFLIL